jgi:hypothetical protein
MRRTPHKPFSIRALVSVLALAATLLVPATAAFADGNEWVGSAIRPADDGYWLVNAHGAVRPAGAAQWLGDMNGKSLNKPITGMATTPSGNGYWLVASDGGIFSFGDAAFFGSTGSLTLNQPIVSMASTPDGHGYWLVARDGGIFAYGDAAFYGSTGSIKLNQPIVGMAATADGHGYWLVASDGGIFSYGNAAFYGSTGSIKLNQPVTGMSSTLDGKGYWLVAADGGIFAYGDAPFFGSTPRSDGTKAVAIMHDSDGGYGIARTDGTLEHHDTPQTVTSDPSGSPDSGSVPTPSYENGWTLEHEDDFNGGSLNISNWGVYSGTGNEGVGYRVPSAVAVSNGELDINDSGQNGGGICWCGSGVHPQTYGRWEVRAKIDVGNGYGPALLLWPDSGVWPADGEIDMSEVPQGNRAQTNFTVHYGSNNSQIGYADNGDFSQWHTFTVEWEPDHISYWIDGVLKHIITNSAAIPHDPMHLAIQNDVGAAGHWIPARDANTPAVVTLHVDYIKMFAG